MRASDEVTSRPAYGAMRAPPWRSVTSALWAADRPRPGQDMHARHANDRKQASARQTAQKRSTSPHRSSTPGSVDFSGELRVPRAGSDCCASGRARGHADPSDFSAVTCGPCGARHVWLSWGAPRRLAEHGASRLAARWRWQLPPQLGERSEPLSAENFSVAETIGPPGMGHPFSGSRSDPRQDGSLRRLPH